MPKTEINIKPFKVPNFVFLERPPRPRQEGINFDTSYSLPLSELRESVLDEMCKEFRAAVFEKAGKEDPEL